MNFKKIADTSFNHISFYCKSHHYFKNLLQGKEFGKVLGLWLAPTT